MILITLIAIPLLFTLAAATASERRVKYVALFGMLLQCAWFAFVAMSFDWRSGESYQFDAVYDWFPSLGIRLSLGVDTISMLLLALTALLGPICVAASFTAITERPRTYYSWLLLLQAAMTGVFCARDVILFYVFFEFTLVPLYILINLYGSTNRKAAATKFFLYTFTGSLLTLSALVYVAYIHASQPGAQWTFDFETLAITARGMTFSQQAWVFWALLAGFAVKVPLFPLHTWLPLAHTEAPTAGSVILAGVLLKLGTYGILRFALGFVPGACIFYAPTLATLGIIGILYAGLICWVQTDVKKLVAYSSVSHLGYCVLGMFALNSIGVTGSILYMINHGLSTGALFLLIGMIYERYHTRSLKEIGGLASRMPVWATFMVFFAMASVGLPGLNGFISEFMCMLGAFQAGGSRAWMPHGMSTLLPGATPGELGPWYAFFAAAGTIVTAMYLLFMLGKVCFGPLKEPGGHGHANGHDEPHSHGPLPRDLCGREIGILLPLAAACVVLGLYPAPVLHWLESPVASVVQTVQMARVDPPAGYPGAAHAPSARTASADGSVAPVPGTAPVSGPLAEGGR